MNRLVLARALTLILVLCPCTLHAQETSHRTEAMFTVVGARISSPVADANGQRVYYQIDSTEIRSFERASGLHTKIFVGPLFAARLPRAVMSLGLSIDRRGVRIAFALVSEDRTTSHVYSLDLDPATGAPRGAPRRVSLSPGHSPSFSPDGKSIAFVGRAGGRDDAQLVVVSAAGGPERVLVHSTAATRGTSALWAFRPIRWSPDGRYLYYTHDEKTGTHERHGIFRIGVTGGVPRFIVTMADGGGGEPSLSPGGHFIVGWDSTWNNTVVTTPAGNTLYSYIADWGDVPAAWLDDTRAMSVDQFDRRGMVTRTLPAGVARLATDSSRLYLSPSQSPDGRSVAALSFRERAIHVFDARGVEKSVPLPVRPAVDETTVWSPDSRSIALRTVDSVLRLVSIANASSQPIARGVSNIMPLRWSANGKSLMFARVRPSKRTDGMVTVEMHEHSVDRTDNRVTEIDVSCDVRIRGCVRIMTDSTVAYRGAAGALITGALDDRSTDRVVAPQSDAFAQFYASGNGQWVLLVSQRTVEVMRFDGTARKTMRVPFPLRSAARVPWISNDGKTAIVLTQAQPNKDFALYRLDFDSGTQVKVLDVPGSGSIAFDADVSADGNSITYGIELPVTTRVMLIDFSSLLRAPSTR